MYRQMRDQSPVLHVSKGDYWVLSRFDDIWEAARDTETFSSASGLTTTYGDMEAMNLAPTMVMMDPPRHTEFRKLVSAGFTPAIGSSSMIMVGSVISARAISRSLRWPPERLPA